jgi:hypothetical protein
VTEVARRVGLTELEKQVDHALSTGDESGIEVLGYGEISCVLAWHDGSRPIAAKRLPLFDTKASFEAYREAFDLYLETLGRADLKVVPSRLETTPASDGRIAAWCVQPLLDPGALAPTWLKSADEDAARWLFGRITDLVLTTVSPRLGVDGQLSNWAVVDSDVLYFDVTTPMLRDERGLELVDFDLFIASLPWALHGLVRRYVLNMILDTYYRPREVLRDFVANFVKEGIAERMPLALDVINQRAEPPIGEAEAHHYYRQDARMYAILQRLRRADRMWQRHVRRRQYPFLLPGRVERHV